MTRVKFISLAVMIILIAGSILYLEGINARPGSGNSAVPVAISVQPNAANDSSSQTSAGTSQKITLDSIAARDRKNGFKPAIELADPTGFINTPAFKLKDLIGKKVILLDFWTYSCINCIRTLPYLTSWYKKYQNQGLEIVGVHTPEFDFEKDINNVKAATQKYGVTYPVVLDSNYGTWQAYGNLYWPHEYLIDAAGYIVHDKIGEGGYDETEKEIQTLLAEKAAVSGEQFASDKTPTAVSSNNLSGIGSPETYFGAARNDFLANGTPHTVGVQNLGTPNIISPNKLYLIGTWTFENEYAANQESKAKIIFKYHSSKVFFVANHPSGATVEVLRDGVPISNAAGSDVKNGKVFIKESRLYNLVNDPNGSEDHILEIIIDDPGLQAFTFTFG